MVYLHRIAQDEIQVDSATIDSTIGTFYLEAHLSEEGFYVLRFQKKGAHPEFVFSNGKVVLSINLDEGLTIGNFWQNMSLTGSSSTFEYVQLRNHTAKIEIERYALKKEVDSLKRELLNSKEFLPKDKKYKQLVQEEYLYIKQFINVTNSPVCLSEAILVLNNILPEINPNLKEEIINICKLANMKFPTSWYVKSSTDILQKSIDRKLQSSDPFIFK